MRFLYYVFSLSVLAFPLAGASAQVVFSRDILPILSDKCFVCHGPDEKERKAGLRLDTEVAAKGSRNGVRAVVAKDLDASELYQRIISKDPDDQMPPPDSIHSVSDAEVELVKAWILQGAEWGAHWAFERIESVPVSDHEDHPVDAIISDRLSEEQLTPNPRASKHTLIRRLSLDLLGLPPTQEQISTFLADTEKGAWERLVDRMLQEPGFGERMAWDWMDAARYADSNGYQGDRERTMWPWRDWVVRAFNRNMPFDQFTIWQLAGDLLPNATSEQILATAFNRNHMINGEGGRIAEENRVDYVFDMTETMGTVWLGLTLNCCRCHDHKYDPLLQREYYQFNAFFNQTPINGGGGNPQTPPVLQVGTPKEVSEIASIETDIKKLKSNIETHLAKALERQANWEAEKLDAAASSSWEILKPKSAKAKFQTLEMLEGGLIYASGENPINDEYTVTYSLNSGTVAAILLDAVRHPKMTRGGLARSDSGNFVLTDIQFHLVSADQVEVNQLEIDAALASFEQGAHKIVNSYDASPGSGWAVWNGKPFDRDHAAVFRFKEPAQVETGATLRVSLKFNSPHAQHNLGYFRISTSSDRDAVLPSDDDKLLFALKVPPPDRSPVQKKMVREAYEKSDQSLRQLKGKLNDAESRIKSMRNGFPKVMVMADMSNPRQTFLLDRGLYNQRGETVEAAVPAFLPPLTKGEKANRLSLARWLVSRENPLTARVTVNRFWQMLFGIGLVKTVEDFGVQAEYPVYPRLLDYLASEFMSSGWNVKHILRTILTSDTYQRSSKFSSIEAYERDPDNRFLARGPRFRMPSWMIRDQALAASGLLNPKIGGAPVNSYQPAGIWEETSFGKKRYRQDAGDKLYRRSLYTFWRRIVGPTIFFDSAKRQVCEVKPLRTNTPLHALTTLNGTTYVEASRALATRVLLESDDDSLRLISAVRSILAREPSIQESTLLMRSLKSARKSFSDNPDAAKRFLGHGQFKSNKLDQPAELAAWTSLCLNLLNLDETLNKE